MTQIMGNENQGLLFEIISARISEEAEEKKYVLYTLQIRYISGNDDLTPSVIERRYTHFLDLYNGLREEHPYLTSEMSFPRKVLLGNFENDLISSRSAWFEAFLNQIAAENSLRTSRALLYFLQDIELNQAKELMGSRDFPVAYPILENSLKLLNKVYMDRSAAVLLALVRLLACSVCIPGMPNSLKWSDLAFHRFEGVSDSDLLEMYLPLLQTCIIVWSQSDRNTDELEKQLLKLQKQGVKCDKNASLIDTVNRVEHIIFG
ncbi:hypothetical protein JTB14_020504 [Gonioctena quinquepunctata]|nr:hypothetical protein JTB14_020504 [Gonioctena quinquepunctata]